MGGESLPLAKANVFNTALPAAEANLLATDIVPSFDPSSLDFIVAISVAGILRVARTAGGITVVEDLNSGVALVANSAYAFTINWRAGESINFRYSVTTGTILSLKADEFGD